MTMIPRVPITFGALGMLLAVIACEDRAETVDGPKTVVPVAAKPSAAPLEPAPATDTSTTVAAGPAPEWVQKGSYTSEDGTHYGVGHAKGINNEGLARQTAGNRARAEIAKMISSPVEVKTGDGSKSVKVYGTTVSGAEIVDHWIDPKDGAVYALARLKP